MPRQLKHAPQPPAKWWPPKHGERQDQAVIIPFGAMHDGRQDVWVRWHGGEQNGRVFGWQIQRIQKADVRRLHAYWLLSMNVHVDFARVNPG